MRHVESLWDRMSRDERIEALTRLGKDGFSASQIASELGCSKNAIVGYWGRNPSLPRKQWGAGKTEAPVVRSSRIKSAKPIGRGQPGRIRNVTKIMAIARNKAGEALPLYVPKVYAEPAGPGIPFLERRALECAWIRDDRGPAGERMCCGEPVEKAGTAWCGWHARIVYASTPDKREKALAAIEKVGATVEVGERVPEIVE